VRSETKTLRYMQKTPFYRLTAHDEKIVAQHHFTGHTHSILYFLESISNPRDREYCRELSGRVPAAKVFKTVILGIAPEPVPELARAHDELELAFSLLSDTGSAMAESYGFVEKGLLRKPKLRPGLIVHDKYGIAYYIGVPEAAHERPSWEEIEATLRRFPRG
jgi:peroxiredoxin